MEHYLISQERKGEIIEVIHSARESVSIAVAMRVVQWIPINPVTKEGANGGN